MEAGASPHLLGAPDICRQLCGEVEPDQGFPGGASGEEPACQGRRHERYRFDPWVRKIPWRRHGNPLHYSCLENPMDRGAWWAIVYRVTKSRMWLKRLRMHAWTWIRCCSVSLFCFFWTFPQAMKLALEAQKQAPWRNSPLPPPVPLWPLRLEHQLWDRLPPKLVCCGKWLPFIRCCNRSIWETDSRNDGCSQLPVIQGPLFQVVGSLAL